MKRLYSFFFVLMAALGIHTTAMAQDDSWPRTINTTDGSILKIYEPAPESFTGNTLKMRSAVSLIQAGKTDPVFGTFWAVATVETDRDNRRIDIISAKVPNIKFADNIDAGTVDYVKTTLESQIPAVEPDLSQDAILASLQTNTEEKQLSKNLENTPPKIIYTHEPSILVVIDGTPKLQHNDSWGLDAVVNTPFTIVKNDDGYFYLYGGKHWYSAPSATGPYAFVNNNIPQNLYAIQTAVDNANASDPGYSSDSANAQPDVISSIIVSTSPAELIQTTGQPAFAPIDGTDLSYVSNSQNDIFQSQSDQQYYVLISGRWYKSPDLNGPWQYTSADNLPGDFAKIPEGSPKDNVLASVAGTNEAREAVMDAEIPQTAKVDRKTATTDVSYDGDPKFDNIDGTDMQYAENTQSSVIFDRGIYYSVDNGVWFQSNSASGPWDVCTDRPDDVDLIPPSCPDYNMKYVYIYDVDPDWVYMGYTPGYLNTYIYGPTVVYGTGFSYRPWYGHAYYPRAYTWGFNMHYSPWSGWNLGYGYRYNWFHVGFGVSVWNGWRGGWWGPAVYRPAFRSNPYRSYGYYGRPGLYGRPANTGRFGSGQRPAAGNNNVRRNTFSNNIYGFRRDVVTRTNNRSFNQNNRGIFGVGGRPATNNNNNNRAQGQASQQPNDNRTRPQSNQSQPQVRPQPNQPNQTGQVRPQLNQPNQQVRPQPANNNIMTDRNGNVYQRNVTNNSNNNNNNAQQWQQRQQNQWKPVANTPTNNTVVQNLNQQQQNHDRGQQRTQNFQTSQTVRPQPVINRNPAPAANNGGGNRGGGNNGGGNNGGRRH